MLETIKQLTDNIPEAAFKTFTSDRGNIFIKNSVYCLMKITLINPLEKIEDFSKFPI